MVLFINPTNCAPGVHTGPAPGRHRKNIKNLLLRNHMAQSFHMLCGPMYNPLLYKCCQRCPWGPYRHVIIYHRLIMEIYEKNLLCNSMTQSLYISYTTLSCGALHKSCQSCPWGQIWPHPGGHYRTLTLLDDFFHVNQNGRKEDTQSRQELFC